MRRDPKLRRLRRKIHANRHGHARHYKRRIAFLQHEIAKVVARRHGLEHETVLDGTPCVIAHKLFLLDCRRHGHWHGVLVSCDRRTKIGKLLHKLGKMTQQELIELFERGEGFPADSIDTSSHTRHSDSVSYPEIPYGHVLPYLWMLGMDVTLWDELLSAARHLGYGLRQPYPSSSEMHHVNLTRDPKHRLIVRGEL